MEQLVKVVIDEQKLESDITRIYTKKIKDKLLEKSEKEIDELIDSVSLKLLMEEIVEKKLDTRIESAIKEIYRFHPKSKYCADDTFLLTRLEKMVQTVRIANTIDDQYTLKKLKERDFDKDVMEIIAERVSSRIKTFNYPYLARLIANELKKENLLIDVGGVDERYENKQTDN